MNFNETFQEFSSKLTTTDLALYAGAGLVLWVLFKDKLSPVQKLVAGLVDQVKTVVGVNKTNDPIITPAPVSIKADANSDDLFFKLVASWKQTRNLAEASGCQEALKVADQMFPYLSPTVCAKKENVL